MMISLTRLVTLVLVLLAGQEAIAAPASKRAARLVEPKRLRNDIKRKDLLAGAQALQDIAFAHPERNRVFGSPGHQGTIDYIVSSLKPYSDYYDVSLQPFTATYAEHHAGVSINGEQIPKPATFTYSPNGEFKDVPIVPVDNLGCDQTDFPADVEGKVALVKRGSCTFAIKVARAGTAKAAAVLVYNNAEGDIAGTLGSVGPIAEGPYVPVAGLTLQQGTNVLSLLSSGKTATASLNVTGVIEDRTTYNVIAETKQGLKGEILMLGAHSDSVVAGPGINDNGSGSVALLTIAKNLAKYSITNGVRFAWWSAEEYGLLGAEHYVAQLTQSQKDQIRLYLNFDMIASPNYVLAVHDGDGSKFNLTGPAGSAQAEKLFTDYFRDVAKRPLVESEFNGRSDYGPFLDAGIAAGGLDTGAEGLKTQEEQVLFGGKAGVAYDVNYHSKGDTVDNLNLDAFVVNAKAISHAVATYALSLDSLGPRSTGPQKRQSRFDKVDHSTHRCGGDLAVL
ncbi:hypothetical protein ACQY0O_002032 [Thecaphora frezii]